MSYDYGYNYGYDAGSAVGGILAGMLIFIVIFGIVALVFAVLAIIGQWKCFKKAGYNGWECLIAGHNQFVNCTFAGVNPILVLGVMFGSVVSVVPVLGWLVYSGFLIYYQFVVGINTAKAFGKGTGFGVALAIPLSAPIAWFILGKDDVKYVGVKKDNLEGQNTTQNNEQPEQPTTSNESHTNASEPIVVAPVAERPTFNDSQTTFEKPIESMSNEQLVQNNNCTRCGAPINAGDKFCMHCGNRL